MYKDKRILAVIIARGGSKGVPRKNVRILKGKPLVAWTIEESKKSAYLDRTIISTDDEEIINVAKEYLCEVPFVRPAELANDTAVAKDVLMHALEQCPGYDYVVMLQPTSPLRIAEDIDGCIRTCIDTGGPSCVTVFEAVRTPYWVYQLNKEGYLTRLVKGSIQYQRRQDCPKAYRLNGAAYCLNIKEFHKSKEIIGDKTSMYCMPFERSHDIDSEGDFEQCEFFWKHRERNEK